MADEAAMSAHPMQPIELDNDGVLRFRSNAIVRFIHDLSRVGGSAFDMNALALIPFTDEDRTQFAQLLGYSVAGYCDLPYVSDESAGAAVAAADEKRTQLGLRR